MSVPFGEGLRHLAVPVIMHHGSASRQPRHGPTVVDFPAPGSDHVPMQTWLPIYVPRDAIATYRASAAVLDDRRLIAQANEAIVVLRQCSGVPIPWTGAGWRNVALTRAWRPYAGHLAAYGYCVCSEIAARGHTKSPHWGLFRRIHYTLPDIPPPWLGLVAPRCRANLLAKNPGHYGQYGWTETPAIGQIWGDIADLHGQRAE